MQHISESDWTEAYIASLPSGEFDWIDFKDSRWVQSGGFLSDLSHYLSAFSNSGGGYLVIGVRNPKDSNKALELDEGTPTDFKNGFKEWLETLIPNQTSPPLTKFNVIAVSRPSTLTKTKEGNSLFVIEVPAAPVLPIQATDHKYYTRAGSKNLPLDHYSILDLLNREEELKVEVKFSIAVIGSDRWLDLTVHTTNDSRRLIRHFAVEVHIPAEIGDVAYLGGDHSRYVKIENETWIRIWIHGGIFPFFPSQTIVHRERLQPVNYFDGVPANRPELRFKVYADNMRPRSGTLQLSDLLSRK